MTIPQETKHQDVLKIDPINSLENIETFELFRDHSLIVEQFLGQYSVWGYNEKSIPGINACFTITNGFANENFEDKNNRSCIIFARGDTFYCLKTLAENLYSDCFKDINNPVLWNFLIKTGNVYSSRDLSEVVYMARKELDLVPSEDFYTACERLSIAPVELASVCKNRSQTETLIEEYKKNRQKTKRTMQKRAF